MPHRLHRLAGTVPSLLWLVFSLGVPAMALAAHDRWARHGPVLTTTDSLQRRGAIRAAEARLDSATVVAARRGDEDLRMVIAIGRGRVHLAARRPAQAETLAAALIPAFETSRDTLGLCRALRIVGRAAAVRGRAADARARYTRGLKLARAARIPDEEGWARLGLAGLDLEAGKGSVAVDQFRRAVATLERSNDGAGRWYAYDALARALADLARVEEARSEYQRALGEAARLGDRVMEAQSTGNLGALEHMVGDPARAQALYRHALRIYREAGWVDRILWASNSLALAFVNQGRYGEADSILTPALPEAERTADLDLRARVLSQMGVVRREQGRAAEAITLGRRAVALTDSISVWAALQVTYTLRGSLETGGARGEELALLDGQKTRLAKRATAAQMEVLDRHRALALRRLGRPREAIVPLLAYAVRRDETRGGLVGAQQLQDLMELARCYQDLGQRDSALVWFRHVAERWERWRASTVDPVWREKYEEYARRFTGSYALAILGEGPAFGPERAREAFDALQRFRARTLADRIRDPATPSVALRVIGADEVRRRVLKPGEAFVDVHTLAETTLVFVLTRDAIHVHGTLRASAIGSRLARFQDLLSDPQGAAAGMIASGAAALGADLFGPGARHLAPARRIIIAAGSATPFALDQLVLPGETQPLIAKREVVWVPSARLLADARSRATGSADRALLAVAPAATKGIVPLPGAQREALWLGREFAGAHVLEDRMARSATAVGSLAARYQILHVASHTRSGGPRPWQDAVRVVAVPDDDAWLSAAQIARLRLGTRLCVMAGCTTLGERATNAETLEGLAAAWLAAGARSVVATRWDVDDEATSELMRRFYRRLARGEVVGAALRGAQLELRAMPRYERPYYWAGATVLGEPDTRLALVAKRSP